MNDLPHIVSIFSGAGGLDWGFEKEGFPLALAIDISEAAIDSHRVNFPRSHAVACDLLAIGPDGVVELLLTRIPEGSRIGLVGGPPCQGFSRANVGRRANDPRNALTALYVSILRALDLYFEVEFAVFENVPGIRDSANSAVYASLLAGFKDVSMTVVEHDVNAADFGVPQNRRRLLLTAMKKDSSLEPKLTLSRSRRAFTVSDAIKGLPEPALFSRALDSRTFPAHRNHWTMRPRSARFKKVGGAQQSGRSFKRLDWNLPSPTIAFGHREIHVHPTGHRRLSIYEAMLIQGFPKSFRLMGNLSQQVEQVSNAVPPRLARAVAKSLRKYLYAEPRADD